jgi:hypothetical protein
MMNDDEASSNMIGGLARVSGQQIKMSSMVKEEEAALR